MTVARCGGAGGVGRPSPGILQDSAKGAFFSGWLCLGVNAWLRSRNNAFDRAVFFFLDRRFGPF